MKLRKFLYPLLILLFAGCKEGPLHDGENSGMDSGNMALQSKAVNTPDNSIRGSLIVYLDGEIADGSAPAVDSVFSDILLELGEAGMKRVFPYSPKDEERTRKFGLHRWYQVNFSENLDVVSVAEKFASFANVSRIQYNKILVTENVGPVFSYHPSSRTSAASGTASFNDPYLSDQWHYNNIGDKFVAPTARAGADINLKDAWKLSSGDPSVIVAVVDQGVMNTHPDLKDNIWINEAEMNGNSGSDDDGNGYKDDIYGYNFVSDGPVTWDKPGDNGHGTHVAGTVAAVNNNGTGVCGVAGGTGNGDGVRIMSCQIFDGEEGGNSVTSAKAFKYAADNGASILQCSFGYKAGAIQSDNLYKGTFPLELDALNYFISKKNSPVLDGGLVIFAAGNDGTGMSGYPGGYSDIISVTAIASDNLPTYYTNYGPGCNIAAPGGEYYTGGVVTEAGAVLSTVPEGLVMTDDQGNTSSYDSPYAYMQGTSMACPHVSGVAALGLSYAGKLGKTFTLEEFKSMLLTSVNRLDDLMTGTKQTLVGNSLGTMSLAPYKGNMGTGSIDAWRFLMQIEGTPCAMAKIGERQRLDISSYMGGGAADLTYLSVEVSGEAAETLGLQDETDMKYGKLSIHPTKPGSAKIVVRAIAGGTQTGSGDVMGGMEISKEISIIARDMISSNGGWL